MLLKIKVGGAVVTALLQIHLEDPGDLADLREWMSGHTGVVVEAAGRPPEPNAQGSVWEFLTVACETGGAIAAVRVLQLWIEPRVTVVDIVGGKRFTVRTSDAARLLPEIAKAARALESGDEQSDERT